MSAGLIKHLKKKTEEDPNTAILMSQWSFDEQLVGKSLENVGSYYPHFSSHNESHSQQILVNIERLLGSNIDKLTATDTWLILEAAYWHDIGMLFSATEVQDIIDDEKFKDYVEELANNNVQDLHEFAKVWHEQGWQQALAYYDNPYTGVEKYRQMVAEWYRRGHAENSNNVVLKPLEKLGINTPRTELLPQRIYRYLGQICWSHGRDFDYVMNHLPYRQTGMGTENCHPRFVACLLRLGDLFDIDDNRFCPVMAKQVGNMPSFSQTHKHKHQAIREFQLDSETVSVTAICESEMAYIECRNWFNWIQEEIQNQMSQWKNIVPSRDFGLLPTIDKLDVEMTDSKILLNDKPMKFSLDERSAIELLQGNNLYKDDMSIYRELIQNATDATMIRVWLEHGQEHSTKKLPKNANPYDEETRQLFADYPITLDCKKIAESDDSTLWEFSIEDNGIGISRKDLEYMQKIAGSKSNKEKQKIISQMPEWMCPSGEFGIGLHSAFLLMKDLPTEQQKITIFTKSRLTHESLKIELNSPLSGKAGYCFIEETNDLGRYGTKLVIRELFDKLYTSLDRRTIANKVYYDYATNELQVWRKIKEIKNYISNHLVTIDLTARISNIDITKQTDLAQGKFINTNNMYWDEESQTALKVIFFEHGERYQRRYFGRITAFSRLRRINIKYKGQIINDFIDFDLVKKYLSQDNIIPLDEGFSFLLDIYTPIAKDIVTLSRDSISNQGSVIKLFKTAYNNLTKKIKSNEVDTLVLLDNNSRKNSLFLKLASLEYNDEWKNFKIDDNYTFGDILSKKIFSFYPLDKDNEESLLNQFIIDNKIDCINSTRTNYLLNNRIFRKIIHDHGFKIYYLLEQSNKNKCLISKSEVQSNIFFQSLEFDKKEEPEVVKPTKLDLDDILTTMFTTQESLIPYDILDHDSFIINTKIDLKNIKVNVNNDDFIVFPYLIYTEKIIEIEDEKLEMLCKPFLTMANTNFRETYRLFKEAIVNRIQANYPEIYDAYLNNRDFKSLDLKPLNKLYEPTK